MEIINRKAKFDFEVEDSIECGLVLQGTEVKSIRLGKANIKDSYGIIKNDEVYILNMHIAEYEQGNRFNHEPTRTRKLLLHKKEIKKIKTKLDIEGYTLVPLKVYIVRSKVKVLMGVAKGRKNYDKRESIKKKDIERQVLKDLKEY